MYKPPINSNRVKYMRSKFENNEVTNAGNGDVRLNNAVIQSRQKTINCQLDKKCNALAKRECSSFDLKTKQPLLSRQLSDPLNKCNIKRTPAFRLEKNPSTHKSHKSNFLENKIKIFDQRLKPDCDNNDENVHTTSKNNLTKKNCLRDVKSVDSSFDNKFSKKTAEEKLDDIIKLSDDNEDISYANLKFLYAEPIPKAYRHKNTTTPSENNVDNSTHDESLLNDTDDIHQSSTLKLTDAPSNDSQRQRPKLLRTKAIDLSDSEIEFKTVDLTDTLKNALKRPLPSGPAPKKPPRTFVHSPKTNQSPENEDVTLDKTICHLKLNKSFTNELNTSLQKCLLETAKTKPKSKNDPMYMLNKLEHALRNNKIRLKKQKKLENTSGEESDCDQQLLSNTNTNSSNSSHGNMFNLNCLSALTCSNTTYERIKEPNSSFFVKSGEEPVYAIPFQGPVDVSDSVPDPGNAQDAEHSGSLKRNSLYYMSSPVLSLNVSASKAPSHDVNNKKESDLNCSKQEPPNVADSLLIVSETITNNIKHIIKAFESKSGSSNISENEDGAKDRVKILESHLRTTLDNFSKKEMSSSSDHSERSSIADDYVQASKEDITTKFETYVRTVRLFADSKKKVDDDQHLFTCCLLVGLCGKVPYIKSIYPSNVSIPPNTEHLCFPDIGECPMDDSSKAQCYSLMITKETGERTYGYCRRVLPEGSRNCLPLVYCILSKHRASNFYKRVLEEIETRHGLPDRIIEGLINEFYAKPFPCPGESICIDLAKTIPQEDRFLNGISSKIAPNELEETLNGLDLNSYVVVDNRGGYGTLRKINADSPMKKSNSTPLLCGYKDNQELVFTLHQDIRYDDMNLEKLCNSLKTCILQKVFASLLLERKVIFVSCILSKLSSCIEALQSILYPFSWPHTFVPVLPSMLWEIVEAPTPIICGVLSVSVVNDYTIENALVVDLDEGAVLSEVGDESKILPASLVRRWKEGLSLAWSTPAQETARNILFSDAFLRVFVDSCGQYKEFLIPGVGFQKNEFILSQKNKGIKRFLKWFTETAMFCYFVDNIVMNPSSYPIFDKRIKIYTSQDAALILEKMKDWKKDKVFK